MSYSLPLIKSTQKRDIFANQGQFIIALIEEKTPSSSANDILVISPTS
jgi:hypothetical protein